jgi:hypothetical protein
MGTITVYTFRDADNQEYGTYSTQDYAAAKAYAAEYRLRIIANEFEWADSEDLDDYTGTADEDAPASCVGCGGILALDEADKSDLCDACRA